MDPLITSSLVGAGADFIGNLFGIGGQAKQFSQQKKLIDHQFNKNVEMWNMQNQYNSPSEQMKRLQQAGLNPNLVYGDGNSTGNTTSNAPEYGLAEAPNYGEHMDKMLDSFKLRGQLIAQQIQESKSREELNGVEHALKSIDRTYAEKTLDSRVKYTLEKNELELVKYGVDIALGRNQIRVGNSQIALNHAQMRLADANKGLVEANTKLKGLEADRLSKELAYYDVNMQSILAFRKSATAKNYADVSESQARTALHQLEAHYKSETMDARTGIVKEQHKQSQYASKKAFFDMKIFTDPHYMAGVVASQYFQGLSAEEQYNSLITYGRLKRYKELYGSGNLWGIDLGSAGLMIDTWTGDVPEYKP